MSYDDRKKKNWWDNPKPRKSTAEVWYGNNKTQAQEDAEHKKRVTYYAKMLGRNLTGSEVLYPDNITKNDRGEAITSYKDWTAGTRQQPSFNSPVQTRQTPQRESSLSGVVNQPTRQERLYTQATGNATDAAPRAQPQLNEWGFYRPENNEFDYVQRDSLGYRNHNPGNLRPDGRSEWDGMVGVDENGFIIFENDHYGIRALARDTSNQQRLNGRNTIEDLINARAPRFENDHNDAYIRDVAQRLGVGPGDHIDMSDPETLRLLTGAIIHWESSRDQYRDEHLQNAIRDSLHRQ